MPPVNPFLPGRRGLGEPRAHDALGAHDRVVALGAGRDDPDLTADELREPVDIAPGGGRQPAEVANTAGALRPAGQRLVDGLARLEDGEVGGHLADRLTLAPVRDAHLDLGEVIENVELGEGYRIEPVDTDRVADDHRVEPPAAAGPSGRGSVFVAAIADVLLEGAAGLGRQRPRPNARGVRLGDADDAVDA